jgi:hypothetical protein
LRGLLTLICGGFAFAAAGLPERASGTGVAAVFAVFAGNYQQLLTYASQKSWASGASAKKEQRIRPLLIDKGANVMDTCPWRQRSSPLTKLIEMLRYNH